MNRLHMDYETGSEENIKTAGAYRYAAHPSTRVLMLGWAVNDEPVELWEPHLNPMPSRLRAFLCDQGTVKHAYNAAFERLITKHVLGIDLPPEQWKCTMVEAYYLGFAGGLDQVLTAIGLPSKDTRGSRLINLFSTPAPRNHKVGWYTWENRPSEWQAFGEYCVQDVTVERQLYHWLRQYPTMTQWDWDQWYLDQRINDRGVPLDVAMAKAAIDVWEHESKALKDKLAQMTGLSKVTPGPFKQWFEDKFNYKLDSLRKDYLTPLIKSGALPDEAKEYVRLWQQKEAKATAKYARVVSAAGADGRARGMFQYKGASRTDRVGGRIIQLQNLKKPLVKPHQISTLVEAIKCRNSQLLEILYPKSVSETLGGAIRHVIHAKHGHTFAIADLASIESVVLGWLANCSAIDNTFRQGRDSYKEFATRYYDIPYEDVTKDQRTFSKPPVLGCFSADTLVLTRRGYVPIVQVSASDEVFDGVDWVSCEGVVHQGNKACITQYGVTATPDHQFLAGSTWIPFYKLTEEEADIATRTAFGWPVCHIPLRGYNPWPHPMLMEDTYDIVNAGPRSRFTILTSKGPMVVHNCGYMLGWKGLIAYAEGYGVVMTKEQAQLAVNTFRGMYPEIPAFWDWIGRVVKHVTLHGGEIEGYRLRVERDSEFLRIWLPSGRALSYYKPEVRPRKAPWRNMTPGAEMEYEEYIAQGWTDDLLVIEGLMKPVQIIDNYSYMGMNDKNQWTRIYAHPGGLTENIVQSIAGDILWSGITHAEKEGLDVVLHVHDEIAAEVPEWSAEDARKKLEECMTRVPGWAPGMWLGSAGFVTDRYTKD